MSTIVYKLDYIKQSLEKNFNSMMKDIENLEYNANLSNNYTSIDREKNILLRKKFVDYLINDIDFNQAVEFLKVDFDISQNIIDNVLKVTYIIFQRRKLSRKIYIARFLHGKGYHIKDIARLLEVSQATARKYTKTEPLDWIN